MRRTGMKRLPVILAFVTLVAACVGSGTASPSQA
jgi:hypothetical protein